DLAVETHKWDGKLIQSTVICFYADTDDYRCAVLSANGLPGYGTTLVRIDFSSIEPPEIKKAIEDNCDTVAKMQTKACRFQAVFTYEAFAAQENASGSRMMEIAVKDSAGVFSRTR
ncbi:MAG TPA: hypothetical protein VEK35_02320, partial [Roseiarcus sp.]|nr:hypothetical protein [Roseiarcus sp.]